MKVAVIGASGYVGEHLCATLQGRGDEVFVVSAGNAQGISLDTGLLPRDFSFPEKVDAVYFLSQSPRYRQVPEHADHLLSVNCVAAVQAAEVARKSGIRRFIYASTGNVYAPAFVPVAESAPVRRDNWYSLSKLMAEDALALFRCDMEVTIARIFGVYGPRQQGKLVPMIEESVRQGRVVFADRNPHDQDDIDGLRVSLIYIDDLVDALLGLLDVSGCAVVNLAGVEAVSIRRLACEIGRNLGIEPRIEVGEKRRETDLIADVNLYKDLLGLPKIWLAEGLRLVTEGGK